MPSVWWPRSRPEATEPVPDVPGNVPRMTILANGAPLNIANGIREFAVASPQTVAVVDGNRSITYRELDDRSSRFAQVLLSSGLGRGERVAVLLGNRLEYCELAAGIAKAGMCMVPVNPRLTGPEVAYIIGHSQTRALVVDPSLAELASGAVTSLDIGTVLTLGDGYEAALAGARPADPRVEIDELDPFCIAYTSGTTGHPKGVLISHRSRSLTFYCTALEWGLGPGRRTLAVAPMYHGAGFAFAYAAVHVGGTVSMMGAWDPARFLELCASERPDTVFLVPTHAQMLRALGDDVVAAADTSSLRTLYFNAAPMPQELKLWVMDAFPHVELHELYGSTEAGIMANLRHADQRRKEGCVGPPWFMTELRLVDGDGRPVGAGEKGEIFTRSPFLMNGYHDDPTATEACTTPDGFMTCGDVGVVDSDGYLYIVDRTKDLIISGGVNVYPREVEEVLITHPDIVDAAVVGRASEQWGEEVVAIVVTAPGSTVDDDALEAHCRQALAGFKVPRAWLRREVLPRNAAGKVLKRELRDEIAYPG